MWDIPYSNFPIQNSIRKFCEAKSSHVN